MSPKNQGSNQGNNQPQPELDVDKRKRIIQKYLQKLIEADPNTYYSPTSEIARGIHVMMLEHKNRMDINEQALVKNLTVRDIETILSYR